MFGSVSAANLPLLSTSAGPVERVSSFKLLGLNFDVLMVCSHHYHCRQSHQTTIFSETAQGSGGSCPTTSAFLRHSNSTCSRILCPSLALCHHSITGWTVRVNTKACAIHIIYLFTRGMSYSKILFVSELTSLESRRDQLLKSFFQDITHPSSFLYHLFPPPRTSV